MPELDRALLGQSVKPILPFEMTSVGPYCVECLDDLGLRYTGNPRNDLAHQTGGRCLELRDGAKDLPH